MTIATVDTNRINNDRVAVYLASTDRRVTIGVRFALEALGIELPDFLRRGRPGPRPNRVNKMMAALDADTGNPNTYRQEKLKIGAFAPRR
jgi:hypothetical protein